MKKKTLFMYYGEYVWIFILYFYCLHMFGGCFFQAKIPAGAGSNCDNIRFMEHGSTIGLLSSHQQGLK